MMIITPYLFYLLSALGVVLLGWIGGLLLMVSLLRRRLNTVTEERDRYAQQAGAMLSILGNAMRIKDGTHTGKEGIVVWVQGIEAGIQTSAEQITVSVCDLEPVISTSAT